MSTSESVGKEGNFTRRGEDAVSFAEDHTGVITFWVGRLLPIVSCFLKKV